MWLWCSKCRTWQEADQFPECYGRSNDHYHGDCKACRAERQRAYRLAHPVDQAHAYQVEKARIRRQRDQPAEAPAGTRHCSYCQQDLPDSEFSLTSRVCRPCHNANQANYRKGVHRRNGGEAMDLAD